MTRKCLMVGSFASIYLLWGSTYLAIAVALQSIPPFTLMGFRSLCGGLVLIALCGNEIARATPRTWFNAGLCGLLFFVGCHGLLAWAQQTVASGVAAIALATIPLWIALIDFLFSKRNRPGRYSLAALIPGFAGVAVVAWQNIGAEGAGFVAIAALLLASLSWAVATILSRATSEGGSTTLLSGMQLSIGGVVLFAIAYLSGEFRDFAVSTLSSRSLEAVLYLTISGSVIGFAAYHWLLQNVRTPLVATYTFINPVVAVVLGVVVLDEPLSMATMAGALLVVASVVAMWAAENFAHPQAAPDAAARSARDVAERNGPQLALEPLDALSIAGYAPENRSSRAGSTHRFSMFRVRPFLIAQERKGFPGVALHSWKSPAK